MSVQEVPLPDSGKTLPNTQAKLYTARVPRFYGMAKHGKDHITQGLSAFMAGVRELAKLRGIDSDSELARVVSRKVAGGPSRKTINNALQGRHDAQIGTLQAIADGLDCPLWVLLLTGKSGADLASPRRERIISMMENYLRCADEDRFHVEALASAFAAKSIKKSS